MVQTGWHAGQHRDMIQPYMIQPSTDDNSCVQATTVHAANYYASKLYARLLLSFLGERFSVPASVPASHSFSTAAGALAFFAAPSLA